MGITFAWTTRLAAATLAACALTACGGGDGGGGTSPTAQTQGTGTDTSTGTLALSASTYSVAQSGTSVTISVDRSGGSAGAASVAYATSNGTATAGTNYTATSGTLSWAAGDASAKTFTIPVAASAAFSGTQSLTVTLSGASGASLGTPASATVNIQGSGAAQSAGTLALSASTYSVAQSGTSVTISVDRSGGSAGAASVAYATSNGTATAGTNYTATSGTLSWAAGDASAKTFTIPVAASPAFSGTQSLIVTLSGASGASLGTPASATVNIQGSGAPTALSIAVQGNHLVNGNGTTVQLRGADVSGLEFVAIQGWDPSDPWGGGSPNFSALKSWKLNAVRFPLNEASWLGLTTYDWPTGSATTGTARQADPGNNYKQTVIASVNAAVAAGMYVILDIHLNSPDAVVPGISGKVPTSPTAQNVMADADHSVAFWTSVANTFKDNPAVIFDLFNEPHIDNFQNVVSDRDPTAWVALLNGGTATQFVTNGVTVNQNFQTVGMQALLNAVRATGATNVVMAAGVSWAQDTSQWTTYAPSDPLHQLAASWHAYPQGFSGTAATVPGFGTANYTWAQTILAANYPIIIGETGDQSAPGSTALFMPNLLPWVDQYGVSVLGWTWNAWGAANDDLITNANGTPTNGFGQAFQSWTVNHP